MVALAGGEPVPVVCTAAQGFKLQPDGAGEGDHAEDQVDHPVLAVEPDRRRLHAQPS